MLSLLLIPLLLLACWSPGFYFVRRWRAAPSEIICVSIGTSLGLLYLAGWAIYLLHIDWHWAWLIEIASAIAFCITYSDFVHLLRRRIVRQQLAAFAMMLVMLFMLLALIQHYSGATWASDWKEHYERTLFFLQRQPYDTQFIDLYILPARPPMMHLIAAIFLAQIHHGYDSFQIISVFLNSLVFFPCVLLAQVAFQNGKKSIWIIAAMLIASPVFVQNVTWTWNKLLAADFVILAIALFLRGWRGNSPVRIRMAALSMAAAILVHFSAAPYALFIGLHYLIFVWPTHKRWRELVWLASTCITFLATWFAWSIHIYGKKTFFSNTTATGMLDLTFGQNAAKIMANIYRSLIPFSLHVSPTTFGLLFDQPNIFGSIRDWYFLICQQSLPGAFGPIGWAIIFYCAFQSLRKAHRSLRIFWVAFACFTVALGIAAIGTDEPFGVAHVCLQSLILIGITFLATQYMSLSRGVQIALVFSILIDNVLGTILHMRMQMLPIHGVRVSGTDIIPLSNGLVNVQGVANSMLRFKESFTYFSDGFVGGQSLILVATLAGFATVIFLLVRQIRWPGNRTRTVFALAMAAVYVIGASICCSDQLRGYKIELTLPTPTSPTPDQVTAVIAPLKQAVAIDPESSRAHYELAKGYYYLADFNSAWHATNDAVLLDPDEPDAHYLLGLFRIVYKGADPQNDTTAVLYYRRHLDDAASHISYALSLFLRGFTNKGTQVLAEAVRRYPQDAYGHRMLAAALADTGRIAEAIPENEIAMRLAPDSAEIQDQMRAILKRANFPPQAIEQRIQEIRALPSASSSRP